MMNFLKVHHQLCAFSVFKLIFYFLSALFLAIIMPLPGQRGAVHAYIQEIRLHESYHGIGNDFTFRSNVPSLASFSVARISEICVRGVWHMYVSENYQKYAKSYESEGGIATCFPVRSSFHYQSLRRGGSSETEQDTLTLYKMPSYESREVVLTDGSMVHFPGDEGGAKSLVVTGTGSWTLYEEGNFTGSEVCISVDNREQGVRAVSDVWSVLGLRQISSVQKGCKMSITAIVIVVVIVLLVLGCIVWRFISLQQKRSLKRIRLHTIGTTGIVASRAEVGVSRTSPSNESKLFAASPMITMTTADEVTPLEGVETYKKIDTP